MSGSYFLELRGGTSLWCVKGKEKPRAEDTVLIVIKFIILNVGRFSLILEI